MFFHEINQCVEHSTQCSDFNEKIQDEVGDKNEVKIIEKILIHQDADSNGICEPVKKIITDLLDNNVTSLWPMPIHVWLNHKEQHHLMSDKIMPNYI